MTVSVLLARQRSGTGALGSVLDQQPAVSYLGEVFHDDAIGKAPNYFWFLTGLIKDAPEIALPNATGRRFDLYTDFLKSYAKKTNVVIDIKYRSTHHFNAHWLSLGETPTLFHLMKERNIPVIHLTRRNHLKTYVSGLLADMNRVWHATEKDKIKAHTLNVDVKKCMGFINAQIQEDERVQRALRHYPKLFAIDYAELFDEQAHISPEVAKKLGTFFGVPSFEARRPAFVKQTSDQLKDVIENYEQLGNALSGSPYAWMLYGN